MPSVSNSGSSSSKTDPTFIVKNFCI
jgi:hypothetical protein